MASTMSTVIMNSEKYKIFFREGMWHCEKYGVTCSADSPRGAYEKTLSLVLEIRAFCREYGM